MSKEVYTPVIDSYRGTEQDPIELPKHIRDYSDIRLSPSDRDTKKASRRVEMSRVWRENYNLGQLFHGVDSKEFDQAHDQVLVHAVNSHIAAQRLVESMDLEGPAIDEQIVHEVLVAIEEEAIRQAELLLPLNSKNYLDEDNVLLRRVKLAEMLISDINVEADGRAIKRRPKTYQEHLKDWRKFEQLAFATEVELLHHQANLDNARFNPNAHRRAHQRTYQQLEVKYSGLFGRIRQLPIDRYHIPLPGSEELSLIDLADDFEAERDALVSEPETERIIGARRTAGSDKTDRVSIINQLLATKYLEPVLREVRQAYEALGLRGTSLRDAMEDVDVDLRAWLTDDEIRDDYYLYEISKNSYDMRVKKGGRMALRLVNRVGSDVYIGLPGVSLRKHFSRRRKYGPTMPPAAKDAIGIGRLSPTGSPPQATDDVHEQISAGKVYIGHGDQPPAPDEI